MLLRPAHFSSLTCWAPFEPTQWFSQLSCDHTLWAWRTLGTGWKPYGNYLIWEIWNVYMWRGVQWVCADELIGYQAKPIMGVSIWPILPVIRRDQNWVSFWGIWVRMILKCLIPVWLSQQDCQSEVRVLTENSSDLIIHKTSPAGYLSRDFQRETRLRATHTDAVSSVLRCLWVVLVIFWTQKSHKTEMNSCKEI